ncbi:MAG: hypothetical protein ACR2IR_12770 [Acidimicrobiia bacterium]
MPEPEVALVFSPESWVEGLHRHLTDHGGARVRQMVMDPALALEEEYGTLVVSHRWPALTRAFVDALHGACRHLLGVYDPGEPAGREHLLAVGVDRAIESDASMSEFLEALVALAPAERTECASAADLRQLVEETARSEDDPVDEIVVVGGPPGGGATEVSIELTRSLSEQTQAILVDADDVLPAVAQRLALPIEPNLRTAVDAVEYGMGELSNALVAAPGGSFPVLCGLPNVAAWSQVRPGEVADVLEALARGRQTIVVNVASRVEDLVVGSGRTRYGITRAALGGASTLVGVGPGTPVGVTRLLGWVADVRTLTDAPLHLVVNESPVDGFRRAEVADEIHRTYPPAGLWFVPRDDRVSAAAWTGGLVAPGAFTRAVAGLAAAVAVPATNRSLNGRGRAGRRPSRSRVGAP